MQKQLSLFAHDENALKILSSFSEKKKAKAVSAIKELFTAEFIKRQNTGEQNGERDN